MSGSPRLDTTPARDIAMTRDAQDGVEASDVWQTVRTKAEDQQAFRRTGERLEAFLLGIETPDIGTP
jgi:hypothetical protein